MSDKFDYLTHEKKKEGSMQPTLKSLTVLLTIAVFILLITGIWTGEVRWIQTGLIMFLASVIMWISLVVRWVNDSTL